MAGREAGTGGERLDAQVGPGMLGDPLLDLAQGLAPCGLCGQLCAELGLVAGPAQEHHEVAGDGQGRVPAQVLLDQGEGEVDAGGDTGGRGDVAVADVDRVGVDVHGRVVAGEPVRVRPVGGRAAAVQQPRPGEQDRSRAHGDQAPGARAVPAQPFDQVPVGAPGALTTRDDQGVRVLRGRGEGLVRYDGQTAGRAHGRAVQRGRTDAVRPGVCFSAPAKTSTGPVTSRLWTSSKRTTRTVRCAMASILRPAPDGRNDEHPTFPAMPHTDGERDPGGHTERLVTCRA